MQMPRKSSLVSGSSMGGNPYAGPSLPCPCISGEQEEREARDGRHRESPMQVDFILNAVEPN